MVGVAEVELLASVPHMSVTRKPSLPLDHLSGCKGLAMGWLLTPPGGEVSRERKFCSETEADWAKMEPVATLDAVLPLRK